MGDTSFFKRALIAVGLLTLAAALFLISLEAIPVLLLIFLAVLLAIFIRTLSDFVHGTPACATAGACSSCWAASSG